jgi:hypothetical protein
MSLNIEKLEKVVLLNGGTYRARCPACAELGGDRKGNHLFIYADGKFGCAANPKDHEHRRQIHKLARSAPKTSFTIKAKPETPKFCIPIKRKPKGFYDPRTPRTGPANSLHITESIPAKKLLHTYDLETPVRNVRKPEELPFLTAAGDLVVPFCSNPRFHWWNGGQFSKQTRAQIREKHDARTQKNAPL